MKTLLTILLAFSLSVTATSRGEITYSKVDFESGRPFLAEFGVDEKQLVIMVMMPKNLDLSGDLYVSICEHSPFLLARRGDGFMPGKSVSWQLHLHRGDMLADEGLPLRLYMGKQVIQEVIVSRGGMYSVLMLSDSGDILSYGQIRPLPLE